MPSAETLERFVARVEENAHAEAIEEFYTPNASMRENMKAPRLGRDVLVVGERKTLSRAKSVKSTCIRPVFVSGSLVVVRWVFEFNWLDGQSTRMEELAYQRWEGERIAEEQFFYDPGQLAAGSRAGMIVFRRATRDDVEPIVRMLADDPLGAKRETSTVPLPDSYYLAFEAIDRDANNELIVVEQERALIGVLQLTYIPYLTYRGGWRALIEGVRIAAESRNSGIGARLFEWAIARARDRGCHLLQLTSDKSRPEAIRFYQKLGFVATHEGFKMHLARDPMPDDERQVRGVVARQDRSR